MENPGKISALFLIVMLIFTASATPPDNPNTFLGPNPLYDDNDAYCTGRISDTDDDPLNVTVNWSVSSNQIYNQTLLNVANDSLINSTLASPNFTYGQEVLCNVTVFNGAIGSSEKVWDFDSVIAETFEPEIISGPNFQNYSSEHAFNTSAVVRDMEGDDELRECWVNASDGDGNIFLEEMNMDRTYGDQYEAQCTHTRIENSTDFEVLENLDVEVFANDSGGDYGNLTRVNPVPNSPPLIYDISPEDDSETSASSVNLEASVLDNDGEKIDLRFYENKGSTTLLDTNLSMSQESTFSYEWTGLNPLETYYWYVNASDGHENVIERLRFRNMKESVYRVRTSFVYRFSDIITSPNITRVVPFRVENRHGSDKNGLESTVSGSDAIFVSTGTDTVSYSLNSGEQKTFRIQISPDEIGNDYLNVVTSNTVYDVSTNDSIGVLVTERPTNRPEVPGLGLFQLLVILAVSTLYYSGRL